jgi:DivIVA domain-containing protein
MELTPESLRSVEFRRKGRGYDADDVDAFRQQVEIWVGETQARLREATAKLEEAETRARDAEERARTSNESDETLQRTLLLAQRTADAAVAEAEETAARKVAEAEAEAEQLTTEARNHRDRAIAEAESEVREAIDLKRAELLDELTTLERARESLQADVAALEVHIEGQRLRVQETRDLLGVLLEDPGKLAAAAPPVLSGVEVPEPAPAQLDLAPEPVPELAEPTYVEPEPEPELAPEPYDDPAPAIEPVLGEPDLPVPLAGDVAFESEPSGLDPWAAPATEPIFGAPDAGEAAEPVGDWTTVSEEAWADAPPPPPPPPPGLDVDEGSWADAPPPPPPPPPDFDLPAEPPAGAASFGGLSGRASPDMADPEDDENPWVAELDQEGAEEGHRSRFGRRR